MTVTSQTLLANLKEGETLLFPRAELIKTKMENWNVSTFLTAYQTDEGQRLLRAGLGVSYKERDDLYEKISGSVNPKELQDIQSKVVSRFFDRGQVR